MSNLSELLPSGGGQNVVEFTASGTLSSGQAVALQSDGTVIAISESGPGTGTSTTFQSVANADTIASVFDTSNNKVVIVYRDGGNSSYGTAVVGTVSGTSISFGTPVVFETSAVGMTTASFDSTSNKVVIAYRDDVNSNYGTAIVGTVSGTSISFGTAVVFESATTNYIACSYSPANNKTIISYRDGGNSNYGTSIVGTVSGTSISFGSAAVFEFAHAAYMSSTFDTSQNVVIVVYADIGNSFYGTAVVGTVSGTSISFGTPAVFLSATTPFPKITFDSSNNKPVIAYYDTASSNAGKARVATVSGTSISFGTAATFSSSADQVGITFDSSTNNIHIAYADATASPANVGKVVIGTVSGTSLSFGTPLTFTDASIGNTSLTFDNSNNKTVISYSYGGTSIGTSSVFFELDTNSGDFIGITAEAISDTATGPVNVKGGINEAQTGLTIGSDYYVQSDGSLASDFISFDVGGATYDSVSFSVASQVTQPTDMAFNADGTKMFVLDYAGIDVNEYTLSTGFDVSTATYSQNFSVSSQETGPTGLAFNTDGTKMFVSGEVGDNVNEYTLSTGFDISTATYSQNFSIAAQDTNPKSMTFNSDGTKMFVIGDVGDDVNEYTLSTGFDVSTASYSQNFSVASQETGPRGITFNPDGTKMFIAGNVGDSVHEYILSTGFDVSTATYSQSFSVASEDTVPWGIAFNTDGTKILLVGHTGDAVYQYSTTPASTDIKAGQAISATTINMMDLT